MCESPAEYAWRRRTVNLATLVCDAVEEDLSDNEREAIEKYWFDGMTITQIAAATGRAAPNVSRTLEKARQKLYGVLRHTVKYQYNLENTDLTPIAVRKALVTAAATVAMQSEKNFGARVKALRIGENISCALLARALAMPESRLLAIETASTLPDVKELLAIAAFFECTTDYLLCGAGGGREAVEKRLGNDRDAIGGQRGQPR
ncbi:MAG TPA: sigma factor-like helix-turn-helix DNA-binding protein [Clostridia bacterium]|nr:sigma factor-like helix-turn-helix DNA-binding protein [Clostridia bacterium]